MQFTNEASTKCQKDAVFAVDFLDNNRHLLITAIPVSETLAQCSFGPQKCAYLQRWIDRQRIAAGKSKLAKKAIKVTTTIQQVINHVC